MATPQKRPRRGNPSRRGRPGTGKRTPPQSGGPQTVDAYLATVPSDARAALEKLRGVSKSAAPLATETISYRIPIFKHHGVLVGFAAFKDHCSFFVGSILEPFRKDLDAYDTRKGTIRFLASKPLPAALVKKIVKARIKQNEAAR